MERGSVHRLPLCCGDSKHFVLGVLDLTASSAPNGPADASTLRLDRRRRRSVGALVACLTLSIVSACNGDAGGPIDGTRPPNAGSGTSSDSNPSQAEDYLAYARAISLEAYAALPISDDQVVWQTTTGPG